jgi:hypothetical protein
MAKKKLTDKEAKAILKAWPRSGTKLWLPPGKKGAWIRALPKDGRSKAPRIKSPGSKLYSTQPDGLWVYFDDAKWCDVVVVEVCGTVQNLNDKRSRYFPTGHSLLLEVPGAWADESVTARGKSKKTRRELAETIPAIQGDQREIPIRHLRVLYALKNSDYKSWTPNHIPSGYEYFIRHSSLDSYTAPEMQAFLRQMSIASQFYTST